MARDIYRVIECDIYWILECDMHQCHGYTKLIMCQALNHMYRYATQDQLINNTQIYSMCRILIYNNVEIMARFILTNNIML